MNEQILQGNWDQLKGKLQEKWGQLTDDDLRSVRGQATQLVGLIERKTGVGREKIERYLDELTQQGESMLNRTMGSAKEYVRSAGETVQEKARYAQDAIRTGYEDAETTVRDYPGASVLAAFGVGLVAGCMLTCALRR